MKNRTLTRLLLIVLITVSLLMYKHSISWPYIAFLHFIGGLAAYRLVLGNHNHSYQESLSAEWGMVFMAGFFGFLSLFVASLPEIEFEEWDNVHDDE